MVAKIILVGWYRLPHEDRADSEGVSDRLDHSLIGQPPAGDAFQQGAALVNLWGLCLGPMAAHPPCSLNHRYVVVRAGVHLSRHKTLKSGRKSGLTIRIAEVIQAINKYGHLGQKSSVEQLFKQDHFLRAEVVNPCKVVNRQALAGMVRQSTFLKVRCDGF